MGNGIKEGITKTVVHDLVLKIVCGCSERRMSTTNFKKIKLYKTISCWPREVMQTKSGCFQIKWVCKSIKFNNFSNAKLKKMYFYSVLKKC